MRVSGVRILYKSRCFGSFEIQAPGVDGPQRTQMNRFLVQVSRNGGLANTMRIARRVTHEAARPIWRLRLSLHQLAGPKGTDVEWNQALLDL